MVSIARGVQPGAPSSSYIDASGEVITVPSLAPSTPDWCQLETDRSIVMSHPQSIDKGDRYYGVGSLSLEAVTMTIDQINNERCGVHINGKNYSISLHTYGDHSDKQRHQAIGHYIVNSTNTNVMIGGYSSGLTRMIAPIAQAYNTVLVAGGSSQTDVFQNRSHVFGIFPRSESTLIHAFEALASRGAKTVAALTEVGIGSCASVPHLSRLHDMELLDVTILPVDPTRQHFDEAAHNMSQIDPDVVVTCVFNTGCGLWVQAMRQRNWSPRAQVFTICVGAPDFELALGTRDLPYMMGATSWNRALPAVPDVVTGWTPGQFADLFEAYTYQNATYQHTAAAASVSTLVHAMEQANSLESNKIVQTLQSHTEDNPFPTVFGETSFDENGQNQVDSLLLQYDAQHSLHVVYPLDKKSAMDLVYPMPTWMQRDCLLQSNCEATGGTCVRNGKCQCNSQDLTTAWALVSVGSGQNASCKLLPEENMNYMQDWWVSIGWVLVIFQFLLSILFSAWTFYYRSHPIIRASQPTFLYIIAFGCSVMITAIIPMFAQGEYRYLQDPLTGELTHVPNPEIGKLDAACMALPWCANLGFTIIFSALFAKIWRVKRLMAHAERFQRKQVLIKDVIIVMVVMLTFEAAILLTWSLVDPLVWNRTVLNEDADGFPIESAGSCSSNSAVIFLSILAAIKGASLIYALYLCWITRRIPSDFHEGRWIALCVFSIFQYLIIGIPVLVIASDDRDASFFVMAVGLFLVSATTTCLIFWPKVWKFVFTADMDATNISLTVRKSGFQPSGTVALSARHSARVRGSTDGAPYNIPDEGEFEVGETEGPYGMPNWRVEEKGKGFADEESKEEAPRETIQPRSRESSEVSEL